MTESAAVIGYCLGVVLSFGFIMGHYHDDESMAGLATLAALVWPLWLLVSVGYFVGKWTSLR